MRILFSLILLIYISCNQAAISDEQRQELKEEKAARKIQRVTEADILNAAKSQAEKIYQQKDINSVKWVSLSDSSVSPFQQKMQEAYQYAFDHKLELYDNIEDTRDGKIIFTRAESRADSSVGYWVIMLDKKSVIKGIQQ